eukprot:jgi/Botrbrau1/6367/Bobra.0098s0026.1
MRRYSTATLLVAVLACGVREICCFYNVSLCDRSKSSLARAVIQKYIHPKVEELHYIYPSDCQLNASRDVFHMHEESKVKLRGGATWRCGQCGKVFRSEAFLDQHLVSQHPLPDSHAGDVCLGDLVHLLHAQRFAEKTADVPGREGVHLQDAYSPHSFCPPSVAAHRREKCQAIGEACFPASEGKAATLLHDLFVGTLCRAHTCDRRTREALLDQIIKTRKPSPWPFYVMFGFLLVVMCLLYVLISLFYLQHGGYSTPGDMKRLRRKKRNPWFTFRMKPKTY